MPYIKPPTAPFARMARMLKGYGLNGNKLSTVLECAPATALKKLSNPELLTLGDLRAINLKAHIPMDEIREAIKE